MNSCEDYVLKPLKAQDAEDVIRLDAHTSASMGEEARSPFFLSATLTLHGSVSVGAWYNNQLVGAGLGCTMGSYGAVLYCCVDPRYQRQGIGTKLLRAVTANVVSRAEFCLTQLSSEALWEVAWLTSCGFQCVEPQFILRKAAGKLPTTACENSGTAEWHDLLNLNEYGAAMEREGLGQLVRLEGIRGYAGTAFVELEPRKGSAKATAAISYGGVTRSLSCEALRRLMNAVEDLAHHRGKQWLVVGLGGVYAQELDLLIKAGWTVAKSAYKFVYRKTLARYRQVQSLPQVDLSHWSL